jgi:PhnB protein
MNVSCHLSFDGQCEVAFRTYHEILGGQLTTLLSFGESPMASQVPASWRSRILHATLQVDGSEILGSDAFPETFQRPQGFCITLGIEHLVRARDTFDKLAVDGTVHMPFQETFWANGFGVVKDKFGVTWEVNCVGAAEQQSMK